MPIKYAKPQVISKEETDIYTIFRVELDIEAGTGRLYLRYGEKQVYHDLALKDLPVTKQAVYALAVAKGFIPPGGQVV